MIIRIILKNPVIRKAQKGFTIVELLVAMAISIIVMAAVYSTYRSQQQSYIVQDQVAAAQQNLRAAMYVMTKDIRMAGFDLDPNDGDSFGVIDALGDSIKFTSDNGTSDSDYYGNNVINPGETITYSMSGKNLVRDAGGGNQVVAENIEALGFAYSFDNNDDGIIDTASDGSIIWAFDSDSSGDGYLDLCLDGTAVNVSVNNVKSVKIWILARTDKAIRGYTDNKTYEVGVDNITPESGYMYRLLCETTRCRNL